MLSAEGERPDGSTRTFHVYRNGSAIYIHQTDPYYRHPLHPSRPKTLEGVRREIALVFQVKVTKLEPLP